LRPIVSTIPTPTYDLSKIINNIIKPYMPNKYSISSTKEFIAILLGHNNEVPEDKILASLDVESLFTNVPLEEAIDITLKYVYENKEIQPPTDISKEDLKKLLLLCTSKCPFQMPNGETYTQIDGVMMGCVLGPTLANFYMGNLEKSILDNFNLNTQPFIYCRYVDDIFVVIDSIEELEKLKKLFELNSILKFTFEIEKQKVINFLDCKITRIDKKIETDIYIKETSDCSYLNFKSICPMKYKIGIIKTLLHRAKLVCSTWNNFNNEV
jgi:hypothetical protein